MKKALVLMVKLWLVVGVAMFLVVVVAAAGKNGFTKAGGDKERSAGPGEGVLKESE